MKKFYLLPVLFLLSIAASAQNQGWLWARSNSNDALSSGNTVAVGADGSVYAAGGFQDVALTFGSDTYTNDGMYNKMFLVKYDASGLLQWSRGAAGSTGLSEIDAITVDEAGNIYVTGRFSETLAIQNFSITNSNFTAFAAKFNPDGDIQWLQQVGSADFTSASDITIYGGFIYVSGSFSGATMTFPSVVLNNNGASDVYIAKYDLQGNFVSADSFGGAGQERATSIEADSSGNLYVAGNFEISATFAGTTVTSNGQTDVFLVKYSNQAQPQWMKTYGGTQYDWSLSLAVDADANVIASYAYTNTVDFEGTTYTSAGYLDTAIIKYDDNGTLQWLKTFTGDVNDYITGITTNSAGQIFTTGYSYTNNITFAGNNFVFPGTSSLFASMLNADGSLAWFTSTGGNDGTEAYGIAVDNDNNVIITGRAMDTTFGYTLLDTGYNMFVAKYSPQTLGTDNFEKATFAIYPNPAKDFITVSGDIDSSFIIFDTTARVVAKGDTAYNAINVSSLPSGLYFLNINNTTTKFIKE